MAPDGLSFAAFLQAPGSTNDHDIGLFEIGSGAGPSPAGRSTVGLYHLAWEVDTLAELERLAGACSRPGAPWWGPPTTAPPRASTPRIPTGWTFEVAWIVPADLLDDEAREARNRLGRLDLEREIERYGATTVGGI